MKKCETPEELREHLALMRENYSDRNFLCSEFLDIDCEYELDGICIDQNIIVLAVSRNIIVGGHDKGVLPFGELFPLRSWKKSKIKR